MTTDKIDLPAPGEDLVHDAAQRYRASVTEWLMGLPIDGVTRLESTELIDRAPAELHDLVRSAVHGCDIAVGEVTVPAGKTERVAAAWVRSALRRGGPMAFAVSNDDSSLGGSKLRVLVASPDDAATSLRSTLARIEELAQAEFDSDGYLVSSAN